MTCQASCHRGTGSAGRNRGSVLAAALALAFLAFLITCACLAHVVATCAQIWLRHNQAAALFLAEAGIQKAASRLAADLSYTGESGTALPGGTFDVQVKKANSGYVITSTGHAASPFKMKPRHTVQAAINILGKGRFHITGWRENP